MKKDEVVDKHLRTKMNDNEDDKMVRNKSETELFEKFLWRMYFLFKNEMK